MLMLQGQLMGVWCVDVAGSADGVLCSCCRVSCWGCVVLMLQGQLMGV